MPDAINADAVESATCFFMSVALLLGLALEFVFHVGWFDYSATLAILGFVAYEAKESFEEAREIRQQSKKTTIS